MIQRLCAFMLAALIAGNAFAEGELPFAKGETVKYSVQKFGVKAGEASIVFEGETQINGQDAYLIVFTSKGMNFYDKEEIYVDREHFRPILVKRDLDIFGKKEQITEEYSSKDNSVKITKTAKKKTTDQTIKKNGPIENLYGFIYRYRKEGSFKIGDTVKMQLPTKDVTIELVKQEEIEAAGRKHNAFFMQSKPAKYKIWFEAGKDRIPLQIVGAVGLASTKMVMTEYKKGQ